MSAEKRKENCLTEILPTLPVGGIDLTPWIIKGSRDLLGIPMCVYDRLDALTEPGKNFISLWSGGNFPFFGLSPSENKLGQEIDSRHASSRGSRLIVSSVMVDRAEKRYVQVLLADLPLLSKPNGFGHVWCLKDYGKSEISEVINEQVFKNSQGLAFIPIPPEEDKSGSGGILLMESNLLRDLSVQETLKGFLRNRGFK